MVVDQHRKSAEGRKAQDDEEAANRNELNWVVQKLKEELQGKEVEVKHALHLVDETKKKTNGSAQAKEECDRLREEIIELRRKGSSIEGTDHTQSITARPDPPF